MNKKKTELVNKNKEVEWKREFCTKYMRCLFLFTINRQLFKI